MESMEDLKLLKSFWKSKKVFITGHTGFKGSWFVIILRFLGAEVAGFSLKPETKDNLFDLAKIKKLLKKSTIGDIRNKEKLKKSIVAFSPDFIVHMAAQPLVRRSYKEPRYTYDVNIAGTLNILEIVNEINFVKSLLIVTTDKVYENNDSNHSFKESNKLGGIDPYSSSKACVEIICESYRNSFFNKKKIFLATCRAGNVIGGGDFSNDRIVPDFVRAQKNKKIYLRSPNSVRPWQHVIDPLYGYLLLLMQMYKKFCYSNSAWNFGPIKKNSAKVINIINAMNNLSEKKARIMIKKNSEKYHESNVLTLNSIKAKKFLNWQCKYNLHEATKLTWDWYDGYFKKKNLLNICQKQIANFFK